MCLCQKSRVIRRHDVACIQVLLTYAAFNKRVDSFFALSRFIYLYKMVFPRITCRHFTTNTTPSTAVIPKLGRHVSRIGFGAYRITPGEPCHAQALRDAVKAGVSIVDTASNFANGNLTCFFW